MNRKEKMEICARFFEALSEALSDTHEAIGSCNHDSSVYLIPKGTEDQASYYGKPQNSFRISDHWNWYSSLKKCKIPAYVQCCSVDMPWARCREEEGMASRPVHGIQVAVYGKDKRYHHVCGDKFDRKTRSWVWDEGDLQKAIEMIR